MANVRCAKNFSVMLKMENLALMQKKNVDFIASKPVGKCCVIEGLVSSFLIAHPKPPAISQFFSPLFRHNA